MLVHHSQSQTKSQFDGDGVVDEICFLLVSVIECIVFFRTDVNGLIDANFKFLIYIGLCLWRLSEKDRSQKQSQNSSNSFHSLKNKRIEWNLKIVEQRSFFDFDFKPIIFVIDVQSTMVSKHPYSFLRTMKNVFLSLLLFGLINQLEAQKFVNDSHFTKGKVPNLFHISCCFHSEKLSKLQPSLSHDFKRVSDSIFKTFSFKEHFIHAFCYPETFNQSCSMFPTHEDHYNRIEPYFIMQSEGFVKSQRQRDALKQNRDSLIVLMNQCIDNSQTVKLDYLRCIVNHHLFELIPCLKRTIEKQKQIKEPYLLTTLCLLMKEGQFPDFLKTGIYHNLYMKSEEETKFLKRHKVYIDFTQENSDSILNLSMAYYEFAKNRAKEYSRVEDGRYDIGEEGHSINPARQVRLNAFYISKYEVTNQQFKAFVDATHYVTLAEKNKDAMVFRLGLDEFEWIQDSTANWRFPNGVSQGGIEDKMNHPVTCISYFDAMAYCEWAKVRLPSIEEWEVAARAGSKSQRFMGDSLGLVYQYANVWHGKNHLKIYEGEDAVTTSPVGTYLANPWGLYDVYGNVFEFCSNTPQFFNQYENVAATRGGSWWCSAWACGFFNSVDIGRVKQAASFSNNGFRVVLQ